MTTVLTEEQQELAAGYVLGDLGLEEMQRFEIQIQNNTALQTEVNALRVALALTSQALPIVTPPIRLREELLTTQSSLGQAIEPGTKISSKSSLRQRAGITWSKIIAGLAIFTTLLLGAYSFQLRQALSVALQKGNTDSTVAILQRPNSRLVSLKGAGNTAAGTLLFTPGQWKEVVVSLGNLPPLPPDQVYRMWLTLSNGSVLPCGSFNTDIKGTVFIKLSPPQSPPKGNKAVGIFVTTAPVSAPLVPEGVRVMTGDI
jgi:anti-sigma-K factor RskA